VNVTLEIIAAKLERIENALLGTAPVRASYTPKEFAKLVGRSYRWTVNQCAARTIRTVKTGGAYLIPASEVERFSTGRRAVTE
jgi:excisionase family DNA binding protein